MKINTFRKTAAGIAALTILLGAFTGCSSEESDSDIVTRSAASTQAVEDEKTTAETSSGQSTSGLKAKNMSSTASDITLIDTAELFSKRDLEQTADLLRLRQLRSGTARLLKLQVQACISSAAALRTAQ